MHLLKHLAFLCGNHIQNSFFLLLLVFIKASSTLSLTAVILLCNNEPELFYSYVSITQCHQATFPKPSLPAVFPSLF